MPRNRRESYRAPLTSSVCEPGSSSAAVAYVNDGLEYHGCKLHFHQSRAQLARQDSISVQGDQMPFRQPRNQVSSPHAGSFLRCPLPELGRNHI